MATLDIPASAKTVSVSIIDSTAYIALPATHFMTPAVRGYKMMNACCFSFLVEHVEEASDKVRRVVFDLAIRRDWKEGFSPALRQRLEGMLEAEADEDGDKARVSVDKDVHDVLAEHGVNPATVEAVVWSHTHLDHTGNMARFGPETALVVGPGFGTGSCGCSNMGSAEDTQAAGALQPHLFPGYPADPDSMLLETDYAGRKLRELGDADFAGPTIGGFRACDYFGDGSFFLLDSPGHSVGHLCGLARVAHGDGSDHFVLMGGDAFHHMAELRPSPQLPLPVDVLPAGSGPDAVLDPRPEPAALLPLLPHGRTQAFCVPAGTKGHSVHFDPEEALATIHKLQAFDGDEHVLVVAAHDLHLMRLLTAEGGLFPRTANDFVARGWVPRSRWTFLTDFSRAV